MREGTATSTTRTQKAVLITALFLLLTGITGAFSITIHHPTNSTFATTTLDLNVTANITVDTWNYSLNGGNNNTFEPNTTVSGSDGQNDLRVYANDTNGSTASAVRYFTVDTTAPTLTPVSPTGGANVSGTINVSATWSDATGVKAARYSLRNTTDTLQSGTLNDSIDTTAVSDGTYNITYNATDSLGHTNAKNRTITVDNTPPNETNAVALVNVNESNLNSSDMASRILNDNHIGVNWSGYNASHELTDAGSGVSHLELWVRNRSFDAVAQNFDDWGEWYAVDDSIPADDVNYTLDRDSNYQYQFKLRVVDEAGNAADSNTVDVTVDTSAPQLSAHSPDAWTNTDSPDVSADIVDVFRIDNTSISMNISNSTWETPLDVSLTPGVENESVYTVTPDSLPTLAHNSTYNVSVNATDRFGQYAALNWSFRTDFDAPRPVDLKEFVTATVPPYDDGSATWYRGNHTVQTACTDSVSGVDAIGSNPGTWNTTVVNDITNITLTDNGEAVYTFRCRDAAKNVNDTQNRTIHIDAEKPVISDTSFGDGATGIGTNFTFRVNFTDYESGINTGPSRVELVKGLGQSGSLSTGWEGDTYVAEASNLEKGDTYTLEVTAEDNVKQERTKRIEFRTKEPSSDGGSGGASGGGGGTVLRDSIKFMSAPSSVSVEQGSTVSFDVNVLNTGDTNQSDIAVDVFAAGGVTTSVENDGFTLAPGKYGTASVTLDAADAEPGTHEAHVYAESDEGFIVKRTVEVDVAAPDVRLEVSGPETVDIRRGAEKTLQFDVTNTGAEDAVNRSVMFDAADELAAAVDPSEISVLAGESVTVSVTVTAADDMELGSYSNAFTVSGTDDVTRDVTVNVQPASAEEEQAISERIRELEERFERVKEDMDEENRSQLADRIQAARTAAESGDYATAAEIQKEVEAQLQGPTTESSVPFAAVVLFLMIAGIVMSSGYILVTHEDHLRELLEVDRDVYQYHEPEFVERAETFVKVRALAVVEAFSSLFERIEEFLSFERGKEETEDRSYSYIPSTGSAGGWLGRLRDHATSHPAMDQVSDHVSKASDHVEKASDHVTRASDHVSRRMDREDLPFVSDTDSE